MDQQVISKIIETQAFPDAVERGISIDSFSTNATKVWFGVLEKYFKKYNKTPTFNRMTQICNDFQRVDSDETLEELVDQLIQTKTRKRIIGEMQHIAELAKKHDPDLGAKFYDAARRVLGTTQDQGVSTLADMYLRVAEYKNNVGNPTKWQLNYGYAGTLKTLDAFTSGVQQGEFNVIAGRLSVGKSNFGRCLAGNFFRQGKNVLCVTIEEQRDTYLGRIDAMLCGLSYSALKDGTLTQQEISQWTQYQQNLVNIPNSITVVGGVGNMSVTQLLGYIERYKPDVLIVDGAYMLRLNNSSIFDIGWQNMAAVFYQLRQISLQYNLPIIALTQLNRETNEDEPDIGNISYADFIGQVASVALMLAKPVGFSEDYRNLHIMKNRDGPKPFDPIKLKVDFDRMKVREV